VDISLELSRRLIRPNLSCGGNSRKSRLMIWNCAETCWTSDVHAARLTLNTTVRFWVLPI